MSDWVTDSTLTYSFLQPAMRRVVDARIEEAREWLRSQGIRGDDEDLCRLVADAMDAGHERAVKALTGQPALPMERDRWEMLDFEETR